MEVANEQPAVSEVHQFPFEFLHEPLDLGDPLVSMPADSEQLPLRRETEAFLDEEELVGPAGAAKDELVHAVPGGVDQSRGGGVDQGARGEKDPAPRPERPPGKKTQDRPPKVVSPPLPRGLELSRDH